jgi:hypothetical protein
VHVEHRVHLVGVMFLNEVSRRMPALLMMMSTLPKVSTAVFTIDAPPFGRGDAVVVGDGFAAGGLDLVDHLLGGRLGAADAVGGPAEVVDHQEGTSPREVEGVDRPSPPPAP